MRNDGRTRRTAVNVAASIAGQLTGKAATLAWTLVAARELPASSFGLFFYTYALAGLASAVSEWGFDPVLVEDVARDRSVVRAAYTRAQAAQTVIALPAFAVAAIVAATSPSSLDDRLAVVLVCVAVLFDLWTDTARTVGVAVRNQVPTAQALVVQRGATAVIAIAVLVAGGGLLGLSSAFLAGSAIGIASHVHALRRLGVRLDAAAVSVRALWQTFKDCAILGITVVVMVALFRLDAVILGVIKGNVAVADYGVAYRLFESTLFLTFSVQGATFAAMAASRDPAFVGRQVTRGFAVAGSVYAAFLAVCVVDAEGVLRLLYGGTYEHVSAGALRWLGAAPACYLAGALCTSALQAVRRRRPILVAAVVGLVVSVVLDVALIPSMAGTGAALATTVSYAVLAGLAMVGLARAGVRLQLSWTLLAPLATAGAIAGLLLVLHLPVVAEVAVAVAVVGVGWLAVLALTSPPQTWRSRVSLIGRMGGSAPTEVQ